MLRTLATSALAVTSALAQSVIVPNASATTPAPTGLNTIIRNLANPRTYQYGINANELAGIPLGSVITGISLRLYQLASNPLTWPPAPLVWSNYDITIGAANPTAGWVADPALNFASPPQVARTGPLTIDANVFASPGVVGVPNPWADYFFDFQTPYLYLGGDLAMLFSHPGSNDPVAALFPEALAPNPATHGASRSQAVHPPGTATVSADFYVMRIHYGYGIGCPGTAGRTPVLVQNANLSGGTGGNILLQIANAPAGALCVFAAGFAQISVPIAPGCDLLVTPDVLIAGFTDANGRAVQNVAVPPGASGSFFAQGGVLDAAANGGISLSNAVSPVVN